VGGLSDKRGRGEEGKGKETIARARRAAVRNTDKFVFSLEEGGRVAAGTGEVEEAGAGSHPALDAGGARDLVAVRAGVSPGDAPRALKPSRGDACQTETP